MIIRGRSIQIGGYFFATIATAAASFFSVPMLIRLLGTEQFGRWSLLEPLQLLLSQVMLLGLNYGIVKLINFDKFPPFSTFTILFRGSQPVLFLTSILAFLVIPHLGFSLPEAMCFALLVYAEAVVILALAFYRASSAVNGYAAGSITRVLIFLTALGITLFGGWQLLRNIWGVLTWRLLSAVAAIVVSIYLVKRMNKNREFFRTDNEGTTWQRYCDAVVYGLPMLVTGLLTMVIEFADRYILKAFFDYTTLAHYVVYLKIAAFLNPFIIAPIGLWWPTERFRRRQSADGGNLFFRQAALIILMILLLSGGVLWFISPWLITWFAPGTPQAPGIVLLLIVSVIFMGMGAPLNISLLDSGKTHLNIYGVLGGALIHIVSCFTLIPPFGTMGAALSTALSYLAYTLLLNFMSQKQTRVPFAYIRMFFLFVMFLVELFIIRTISSGTDFYFCIVTSSVYALVFSITSAILLWYIRPTNSTLIKEKQEDPYVTAK